MILIDHHKTTLDAVSERLSPSEGIGSIRGKLATDKAGCELVWEYIYPEIAMPKAVRLLGRYDIWDQSDPDTLPFQYGMRMYNTDPSDNKTNELWYDLMFTSCDQLHSVPQIADEGNTILKYINAENGKYANQTAFEVIFKNYKCIWINRALGNSMFFDSVYDPQKHDLMMPFYLTKNGVWTVSLYTTHDHIDCSEIAKKMGGGGHKKACLAGLHGGRPGLCAGLYLLQRCYRS